MFIMESAADTKENFEFWMTSEELSSWITKSFVFLKLKKLQFVKVNVEFLTINGVLKIVLILSQELIRLDKS